ncbi:MAG: hypothetical protein H6765_03310 [Candidatus Peribacteria bacterium]|nr:MAG: hypothetical protein H6765_03310 [Candidatus Peribacteria bacterium]
MQLLLEQQKSSRERILTIQAELASLAQQQEQLVQQAQQLQSQRTLATQQIDSEQLTRELDMYKQFLAFHTSYQQIQAL